jgi:hypothetical protein
MEAQIAQLQERLDDFRMENIKLRRQLRRGENKCIAVTKKGKYCDNKGDYEDGFCKKHFYQDGEYFEDCIAISENGEPCSEEGVFYWLCEKHFEFYEEKSFEIIEPITYNIIKKMPFPLDVSIKILNLANSKIEIDDMIKYKISPSKLSINPVHKGKLEQMLENRIPRFDVNKNIWRLIHNLISVYFHPAEQYYTYRICYSESKNYTYKMQ